VRSDPSGMHAALPLRFFLQRYPETYVEEVREFLACVANDTTPPVTGKDGKLSVVLGYAALEILSREAPVRLSEIVTQ